MTTLEFIKNKKRKRCRTRLSKRTRQMHQRLGRLLSGEVLERDRMEVRQTEVVMLPAMEQDFMF